MQKISIIIPVYNVERYLAQCIDSVRRQNYKDIEIICVNDGSTDRSREILSMYQAVDPRLVVVDKENGGPSAARNLGLLHATGDIVWFIDSDDLLSPSGALVIAQTFARTGADVITFGGFCYPEHYGYPWLQNCLSPREVTYEGFDPALITSENSRPFAWRSAFTRSFLMDNNIRFDEDLGFGEDQCYHFSVYPRSKKTVLIPDKLYYYRLVREGSLMATRRYDSFLRLHDHLRVIEHICQDWADGGFLEEFGESLLRVTAQFALSDVLGSPYYDRIPLCNYLEAIWTTFFNERQLQSLLNDREFGAMAKAVLVDRKLAFSLGRKRIFYMHTLKNDPRELFRQIGYRFKRTHVVRAFSRVFSGRVPISTRKADSRVKDVSWQIDEMRSAADALRLLQMEYDIAMGSKR